MLTVQVDSNVTRALSLLSQDLDSILASALRSEAYRLNTLIQETARSEDFGPFAPYTVAARKGRGYGPWFARFSRYFVDPEFLEAGAGLLGPDEAPRGKRRFAPISRQFVRTAAMHAKGYTVEITRERQRKIAQFLQKKYGGALKRTTAARNRRTMTSLNVSGWHKMIPRVGTHTVKARPIVSRVWTGEESNIQENIRRMVMEKLLYGRYRDVLET
jgi:hypothetical protein